MAALNTYTLPLPLFQEHFEELGKESNPRVLVNTFDALEPETLRAIKKFSFAGIGSLIPLALLDRKDPSNTAFGGYSKDPRIT